MHAETITLTNIGMNLYDSTQANDLGMQVGVIGDSATASITFDTTSNTFTAVSIPMTVNGGGFIYNTVPNPSNTSYDGSKQPASSNISTAVASLDWTALGATQTVFDVGYPSELGELYLMINSAGALCTLENPCPDGYASFLIPYSGPTVYIGGEVAAGDTGGIGGSGGGGGGGSTAAAPEPSAVLLLSTGLAGVAAVKRRWAVRA